MADAEALNELYYGQQAKLKEVWETDLTPPPKEWSQKPDIKVGDTVDIVLEEPLNLTTYYVPLWSLLPGLKR